MKRWLITLVLSLTLGVGLLTGCGAENEGDDNINENAPGMVQPGEDGEGIEGGESGDD